MCVGERETEREREDGRENARGRESECLCLWVGVAGYMHTNVSDDIFSLR